MQIMLGLISQTDIVLSQRSSGGDTGGTDMFGVKVEASVALISSMRSPRSQSEWILGC